MIQKYFIAIVPPTPILQKIQSIKHELFVNHNTKGALRSPAHITLHMPFNWDDDKEQKLISTLESFNTTEPFEVFLNDFFCFEPRVVFIGVSDNDALYQLQKRIVLHVKKNLQLFNQYDDKRGFHPHITIAFRDLKKPVFYKIWNDYKDKKFEAVFNCSTICLLKHINDKWEVYKEFDIVK